MLPKCQCSSFLLSLFTYLLQTYLIFPSSFPFFSPSLAVVSNNLGFYKQASIIYTAVLGVILKPPFCASGFNLSHGFQTHSTVGLTTFPTFDKLPISLGFAISALFSCGVSVCVCYTMPPPPYVRSYCVQACVGVGIVYCIFVHRCICVCRAVCYNCRVCMCLYCVLGWPCQGGVKIVQNGEGR